MANFTAQDVKKLREDLGAGMMDAKNALVEADGDYDKAVELLRIKGAKAVAKRDDRATSEGVVVATADNGAATVVELASETDFVAKNEKFTTLADKVLAAVAAAGATDVASANQAPLDGKTVLDVVNESAARLGEKLEVRTVRRVEARPSRSTCTRRARTCRRRSPSSSPTRATTRRGPFDRAARRVREPVVPDARRGPGRGDREGARDRRGDHARRGQARGRPPEDRRGSRERLHQGHRAARPGLREGQQDLRREGRRERRHHDPGLRPRQGRRVTNP